MGRMAYGKNGIWAEWGERLASSLQKKGVATLAASCPSPTRPGGPMLSSQTMTITSHSAVRMLMFRFPPDPLFRHSPSSRSGCRRCQRRARTCSTPQRTIRREGIHSSACRRRTLHSSPHARTHRSTPAGSRLAEHPEAVWRGRALRPRTRRPSGSGISRDGSTGGRSGSFPPLSTGSAA